MYCVVQENMWTKANCKSFSEIIFLVANFVIEGNSRDGNRSSQVLEVDFPICDSDRKAVDLVLDWVKIFPL